MNAEALEGGFDNPPIDASYAFRSVMQAMARPGTIQSIAGALPPAPLSTAAGTCLLMLCDQDTPVFLADSHDNPQVRAWLAFHTGAPLASASDCLFAVGSWTSLQPLDTYSVGTAEYPDRSSTLIVELDRLEQSGAALSGPGIKSTCSLALPAIEPFQKNHLLFPLGLDFIFTNDDLVAALPRSTEVR